MDSLMVGIDLRDNGKTRVSILEPAHSMTLDTFSFPTHNGPPALTRRLEFWRDQGMDIQLAICLDDPWPYDLGTHLDPTWRIKELDGARVEEICLRTEAILGCQVHRHRSKLLAFLSKYDSASPSAAQLARKWAIRMAREFLFSACWKTRVAHRHHLLARRTRLLEATQSQGTL